MEYWSREGKSIGCQPIALTVFRHNILARCIDLGFVDQVSKYNVFHYKNHVFIDIGRHVPPLSKIAGGALHGSLILSP